ncbi:MAG: type IX secretion system sortase PorU, partial [Bacteroidetes bacterium]|nr:type IX secretion system sortase PorU [Fibrella sp.]
MTKRLRYCGFLLMTLTMAGSVAAQPVQSVLRTGTWLKIGVTKTGVCKLDYTTLTKANPAFRLADPRQFRLFGNGGASLPQPNAVARPLDLTENALQVTGETDGRFDPADAILFFAQSPTTIQYDSSASGRPLTHRLNPYSDTTFYFLTIGPTAGLRLPVRPAGTTTGTPITSYDEYVFREEESVKPIPSGLAWLGDDFQTDLTRIQSFAFAVPGRLPRTPVLIRSAVMASSTVQTTFSLQLNGQDIGKQVVSPVADVISRYSAKGILNTSTFTVTPATADDVLSIRMDFDRNGGAGSVGYLDFISVQLQREIRQYNQPILVRTTTGLFSAKQATSALRIWDISHPLRPLQQAYTLAGTTATWSSDSLRRHDYFLFTDAQVQLPASVATLPTQNLHGQPTPNLIIVTPVAWRGQAERLAAFRRTNDKLSVLVATTQEVYNEFGSGQPDPTAIRDLCRYFYQQNPGETKYLLLFGDATFDYRNKRRLLSPVEQANTVPVYESRESLHPILSFSSDDYFGFLKDSDGEWAESNAGDQTLTVGVGRLPVKSSIEAKIVVDKLIRYASDKSLAGDWQSKVLFVADDGDDNIHQKDAHQLASYVESQASAYRPERAFLDIFQQTTATVGGTTVELAPSVNQLINRGMQDGRLIVNYTGHGGTSGWAQEQVLTRQDILSWKNTRLPLFVTATCEFGRYDDPAENSGAELALLSATGGAIGLLTTTRPVFADKNLLLNQAFYRAVFRSKAGQIPRLGDIMRSTKDSSLAGVLNRNFALLGDPSMQLAYPRAEVALTQVNGRTLTTKPADTLSALQRVELTGVVRQPGTVQPL